MKFKALFLIAILIAVLSIVSYSLADNNPSAYLQQVNLSVQADPSIYVSKGAGKVTDRTVGDDDLTKFYNVIKSEFANHNVGVNPNSSIQLIITVTEVKKVPSFKLGVSAEKSFIKAKLVLMNGEKVVLTDSVYGSSKSSTPIVRTNDPFEGAMKDATGEIMQKVFPLIIPGFPVK